MSGLQSYAVVEGHIVGNSDNGFELECSSDRKRYATRLDAIHHGFDQHGHDDWWIATIESEQLVDVRWMADERERDEEEYAAVAAALGLPVAPVEAAS